MKDLFKSLKFIFMPSYWLMNYSYNKTHDKKLNQLMDKYKFKRISQQIAILGDVEIWVSNFPYAISIYELHSHSRPSRLTIQRLGEKLIEDTITI